MDFSEEMLEQVDRYLDGQLSKTETLAFEQKMEDDAKLKDWVGMQQEIVSGIKKTAHLEFKKKLNGMHEQMPASIEKPQHINRKIFSLKTLSIAASVVILIVAGWLILGSEKNKEEIFAAPNKKPVFTEKYVVKPSSSETIDVIVYDWNKKEWKYNFKNQRFTLMIPNGADINKESLEFFKNDNNRIFVKYKDKSNPIKSSENLQVFDNE